eukprot:6689181-Alexandrium_andersonii.AAC.1
MTDRSWSPPVASLSSCSSSSGADVCGERSVANAVSSCLQRRNAQGWRPIVRRPTLGIASCVCVCACDRTQVKSTGRGLRLSPRARRRAWAWALCPSTDN